MRTLFTLLFCITLCNSRANADSFVYVTKDAYKAQKSAQKHEEKLMKLQQEHARKLAKQKVQALAHSRVLIIQKPETPKVFFYYSK